MFSNCTSLTSVILPTSLDAVTNMSSMFNSCTTLNRTDLVGILTSLPTSITSQTIDFTGAGGVGDLTIEDRAIGTDKGWTVTTGL